MFSPVVTSPGLPTPAPSSSASPNLSSPGTASATPSATVSATASATAPATAPGTAVEFAYAARVLGREARRHGLVVPGFRSPPRVVGAQRTLRRHSDGAGVVVAVQVRGRPWFAVVADMIEGVVVANGLQAPTGDRLRTELWEALGYDLPGMQPVDAAPRVA